MNLSRRSFLALGPLAVSLAAAEGESLPNPAFRSGKGWVPLLNGRDLSGWTLHTGSGKTASGKEEWTTASSVSWSSESPEVLRPVRAPGGIIANSMTTRTMDLVTERKFGDFELYLEFMMAKGSNSGVYHHGLYEVQLFDSYGDEKPLSPGGHGGIYQRWADNKAFGGTAPRTNASKPPGQWQSLHTRFRGPRTGATKASAKFESVILNGMVVHENVEPGGPTRSSMEIPEAAENPLMLQGDHGPVAFRNIYVRKL